MAQTNKNNDNGPAMVGGVTDKQTEDVFQTSGSEPVRDKSPDDSKGRPVKRFFTKDGTPVEPSSLRPEGTPWAMREPDAQASAREDVVEVWEYLDADGNTVTHDSAKAAKEDK